MPAADGLTLSVPHFRRLDEYCGVWAMDRAAFLSLWQAARDPGLSGHVLAARPGEMGANPVLSVPGKGGTSVAVVQATGTLMKQRPSLGGTSMIDLRRQVRQAAADPNVSGVLLAIDSPGGSVRGMADLASEVRQAARKKPVWSYVEDMGASAAYWLAASTDRIFANADTALVGSIGSILTVYDTSEAAAKDGVKTLTFATGPLKAAGEPGTPVTDEQRAYFQSVVDATQESFDAAVRKGRGLSAAGLAAAKTGGVFPAREAQRLGLIDGIKGMQSVLAELASAR